MSPHGLNTAFLTRQSHCTCFLGSWVNCTSKGKNFTYFLICCLQWKTNIQTLWHWDALNEVTNCERWSSFQTLQVKVAYACPHVTVLFCPLLELFDAIITLSQATTVVITVIVKKKKNNSFFLRQQTIKIKAYLNS